MAFTPKSERVAKPKLDELPCLATKMLKKFNILLRDREAYDRQTVSLPDVLPGGLEVRRTTIFTIELVWREGRGRKRQLIGVEYSRLRLGWAPAFYCYEADKLFRSFYFYEGRWRSREALKLRYASQDVTHLKPFHSDTQKLIDRLEGTAERGPARGANRQALIDELVRHHRSRAAPGSALLKAEIGRRQRERAAIKLSQADPMLGAFKLAQDVGQRMSSAEISERVLKVMELGQALGVPPPKSKRLSAEGQPMLDIRHLEPKERHARARRLAWHPPGGSDRIELWSSLQRVDGKLELWVVGGPREEDAPYPQRYPLRQAIKLEYGVGRRSLYMICPATGARCLKLYLRNGFFASLTAHHMFKPPPSGQTWKDQDVSRIKSISDWRRPARIPRRRTKKLQDVDY